MVKISTECDALIVGGGAAGSVCALELSKKMSTVLIERKSIGEHTSLRIDITPDDNIGDIIRNLKLPIAGRMYKTEWYGPSYGPVFQRSEIPEYKFLRGPIDSFEIKNIENAEKRGCKIFTKSRMKIIKHKEYVEKVVVRDGVRDFVIKPRIVIAADGANSVILKKFCIDDSKGVTAGCYGFSGRNNGDVKIDRSYVFFDFSLTPGGYAYLAATKEYYSVGLAANLKFMNMKKLKCNADLFRRKNKLVPKKFDWTYNGMLKIATRPKLSMGNVIFVGSAAGLSDPIFGYGMGSAIRSGYLAARYCEGLIDNYEKECLRGINNKFDRLVRGAYDRLKNEDVTPLLNFFEKAGRENIDLGELKFGDYPSLIRLLFFSPHTTFTILNKMFGL